MIRHKQELTIIIGCLLLLAAHIVVAEPPKLAHNPFSRPSSERTSPQPAAFANSDAPRQALDLRATLVGTRNRLANVGGRIVRPGSEVDGYTLLKVYENHAVFSRQGKQETIYVKPDPVENDE